MINILVADDHRLVREGLKEIINNDADFTVIAEAASGREAIQKVQKIDCEVALLDVNMPEGGGMEALKQIKSIKPEIAILILSVHTEPQYAIRFLRAGASGYLTKECASEELLLALRRVSQNRKYISADLAEELAIRMDRDSGTPSHALLSDREFEIAVLIASGQTISDIAVDLSLSAKTVSTYRSRVFQKMDLRTNVDLTRYALQYGLIE